MFSTLLTNMQNGSLGGYIGSGKHTLDDPLLRVNNFMSGKKPNSNMLLEHTNSHRHASSTKKRKQPQMRTGETGNEESSKSKRTPQNNQKYLETCRNHQYMPYTKTEHTTMQKIQSASALNSLGLLQAEAKTVDQVREQ